MYNNVKKIKDEKKIMLFLINYILICLGMGWYCIWYMIGYLWKGYIDNCIVEIYIIKF